MKYFVLVIGVLLVAVGGEAIWNGYDIIQVERGWSSVIAGAAAAAGGFITIAIGGLIWRVDALRDAVLSLRDPIATETDTLVAEAPVFSEPARMPPAPVGRPVDPAPALAVEPPPFALTEEPTFQATVPPPPPVPSVRIQPVSNVASLPPRPERPPVRSPRVAPPVEVPVPVAAPPDDGLRRRASDRAEPADLTQRLRRVPLTKQQAIAHALNPDLAEELDVQERSPRAAPPRSASLSVGAWPERPSIVASKRPAGAAAVLPIDAASKPAPEESQRSPADMHDWIERALAGGEDNEKSQPDAGRSSDNGSVAPGQTAPAAVEGAPVLPSLEAMDAGAPTEASPPNALDAGSSSAAPSSQSNGTEPVARYEARGTTYAMFADGSIEAETGGGRFRFASMEELRRFIEERQA